MRVAVSPQHRFLYNRLPKNANSTITRSLVDGAAALSGTPADGPAKRHFQRPSRMSGAEVAALGDYFKFVFVRDPYSRTLSAYLDKIVNRRKQSRSVLKWAEKHGIDAPSFADFCAYLDDGGLYDDNHWAPQTAGLVLPLAAFDFIGRFETLDRDLKTVHDQLFPRGLATTPRDGPAATGSDTLIDTHYTPVAKTLIRRLFNADFEALGYPDG